MMRLATCGIAMGLLALMPLQARFGLAQTATLDAVDVQQSGREFIAIRDGRSRATFRLESSERVRRVDARGIVGFVLTDRRWLAVSTGSSGWREERFRVEDRPSPAVHLGANLAVMLTPARVVGFNGLSGTFAEARLSGHETVLETGVNEHVAVTVTDRRVLGLDSRSPSVASQPFGVSETFESLRVLARTATVRTSERILSFGSSTGSWRADRLPLH